ncbi:MAG: alpha/beta hydrolase [Phycisphaerales bacterium]|jgi:pimeloyl-ACP methyl ester carboxylesterase
MRKRYVFLMCGLLLLPLILTDCKPKDVQQTVSSDNIEISYCAQGQGKPALVFVHGWSCDKSFWKRQVPHFAKNHKVVTIDLGGHGDSGLGRKEWTVEAYGKDVVAVVKKLDIKNVILIGHSMGGPVIVAAARLMPEKVIALVGADTFHDIEQGYSSEEIKKIAETLKVDFVKEADSFARQMFPTDADPDIVEQVTKKISSANPRIAINSLYNLGDYDLKKAFEDINVPVYSISSDFWPTDFEKNKKYVESFEVKMMPGIGHFVMLEDSDKFNRLLDEIVNELCRQN